MKVGLYSISCSGTWFNDRPALTVEEFIDTAKKYGYDGVEIDLKRPHGSPLDLDEKRCKEIRDYAAKQGLEICGVAANNPTKGVDIHSRQEIHKILRKCAEEGMTVIISSSETEELLAISDRIYVFYEGCVSAMLSGGNKTPERLVAAMMGMTGAASNETDGKETVQQ